MKNAKNKLSSPAAKTGCDDEIIGTALSRGLERSGGAVSEECPGPGEIAAVVEGHVPAEERDRVLKHAAVCADCYESFLLVVELHRKEENGVQAEKVSRKVGIPRFIYWRSLALAASVLIMVFSIYVFFQDVRMPKSSQVLVEESEAQKGYETKMDTEADAGKVAQTAPLPPPPSSPAKSQPRGMDKFAAAPSPGARPEPMLARRSERPETGEEAPAEAPPLLGAQRAGVSKLKQTEADDETKNSISGVSELSDKDTRQDKKEIPIQLQVLILMRFIYFPVWMGF